MQIQGGPSAVRINVGNAIHVNPIWSEHFTDLTHPESNRFMTWETSSRLSSLPISGCQHKMYMYCILFSVRQAISSLFFTDDSTGAAGGVLMKALEILCAAYC